MRLCIGVKQCGAGGGHTGMGGVGLAASNRRRDTRCHGPRHRSVPANIRSGRRRARPWRDRIVRNCLIAAGNARDASFLPQVQALLDDPSAIVRAMAVWAYRRLATPDTVAAATAQRAPAETDPDVRKEWA